MDRLAQCYYIAYGQYQENSVLEYEASNELLLWILFEMIAKDGDSFEMLRKRP